ncbi:hypothetical protein ACLK17_25245 [Escherichia coli]
MSTTVINGQRGAVSRAIGGASDLLSQISDTTRDGPPTRHGDGAYRRRLAGYPSGLRKKSQESGIEAIAEAVRERNYLLFIVVTDMQVFATRILSPAYG